MKLCLYYHHLLKKFHSLSSMASKQKHKVVCIMGATGTGKSKLSIDLATRYFPNSEVINSDKMQVYKGLDITTNKISMQERKNVPHHLLGTVNPVNTIFTPSNFRSQASKIINDVVSRGKLPLIVGGSNSLIHALLVKHYNETMNPFSDSSFSDNKGCHLVSSEFRYRCCFIWVDVAFEVLDEYLCDRVDDMLKSGMLEELAEFYRRGDSVGRPGLTKAIGVPEFRKIFEEGRDWVTEGVEYEKAVRMIKDNTRQLAKKQMGKIERLREAGWALQRVDATAAFRAKAGKKREEVWERDVLLPSVNIVNSFLDEE